MTESVAIINWINTFECILGEFSSSNITDLADGIIIFKICNEISPEDFELDALNSDGAGNWVIASSNLKKLFRLLDNYFRVVLSKKIEDLHELNADKMAREPDVDTLQPLLELVIGAAVMCENKGTFISRIFALDQDSQVVLKQMIESVMSRVTNVTNILSEQDEFGASSTGTGDESEDLVRAQELTRHLQEERTKLLREVESLERSRASIQLELETSHAQVQSLQQLLRAENADNSGSDSRVSITSSSAANATLQAELEELRRELDLQTVENANLKATLKTANQRSEASREVQAKLEMELHQMTDELDVNRDKAQKLAKAEATIDKYQKKLEEMVSLKKQNKEFSDKLESYFDKIQELESGAKSIGTLNKLVEQYRDKAVELEREKFEVQAALELSVHEVRRLQGDIDTAHEAKRFLEDEVESLRVEVQSAQESRDAEVANQSGTSGANSDVFEVETVTTLREKVHKLEREIGLLRLSPLSQTDTSQLSSTTDSGASSTDVTLLQAEIHDLTASKKEREEALIGAKKHSAELQAELNKVHRALADTEASLQAAQATAATLKDAQQKSTIFSGTAKMLEEKLKLAEANADRLEQDRSKLEAYARRTLSCFKDKYMSTLQTMKSEKRALEERVTQLTSRHERNQETTRREERLMMSAMYEIGVRMMDRKIQEQVLEPANQQMGANTFLGAQRQSQVAMLGGVGMTNNISQLGVQSSPVPMTPSK